MGQVFFSDLLSGVYTSSDGQIEDQVWDNDKIVSATRRK
jgi:hypothetical protein